MLLTDFNCNRNRKFANALFMWYLCTITFKNPSIMLHYKVYQNNSKNSKLKGKWFARAAVIDTIVFNLLYPFCSGTG